MTTCHRFRLLSLISVAALHAQVPDSRARVTDIRVNSDLILINALVTDGHGRVITGLDASRFRLFEDGKEQVIKYCIGEDVPVSVGLVLDTSGSMRYKLDLMKQAAIRFVRAANPADEYFLIEFEARPRVVLPFTTNTDQLLQSIGRIKVGGSKALFDAIHLAVHEMHHAGNPRKALVIVSDGMDHHSYYRERQTQRLISEIDFPIYAINVWQPQHGNRYAIQRRDPETLETISAPTGGRAFAVRDLKKLPAVSELISLEIRHEYVLEYVPPNRTLHGKFHKVRVNIRPSLGQRFRISSRAGYYAPVR